LLIAREHEEQQDDAVSIEVIDKTDTDTVAESKNDDVSMNQCISLLDPHLTAFRDKCDTSAKQRAKSKDKSSEPVSDEIEDEVPSQLLRLARFFAWRWLPIKKALLRPPPSFDEEGEVQEVELSLTYRLRMAKACWKRGLLAAAEYESLCASFDNRKRNCAYINDGDSKRFKSDQTKRNCAYINDGDSKRFKSEQTIIERVRLALMRLPTEIVTNERAILAWRHVNEMLAEFCKSANSSSTEDSTERIDQVADWALTSWTALVLSQGMDASTVSTSNHDSTKSSLSTIENQFAHLLSNREASCEGMLAQAVATRVDNLLSPESLKGLSGIHIFSLGRLFARFDSETAEEYIAKSMRKCAAIGGMTCLEQLSRLVATYVCSLSSVSGESQSNRVSNDLITGLEKRLISKMVDIGVNKGTCSSHHNDQNADRSHSFLNVALNAAAHLVRSSRK
jgi:hypothetical protein